MPPKETCGDIAGVECPYCGYVDRDAWEWNLDCDDHECGHCEKVADMSVCITIDITLKATEGKDEH